MQRQFEIFYFGLGKFSARILDDSIISFPQLSLQLLFNTNLTSLYLKLIKFILLMVKLEIFSLVSYIDLIYHNTFFRNYKIFENTFEIDTFFENSALRRTSCAFAPRSGSEGSFTPFKIRFKYQKVSIKC